MIKEHDRVVLTEAVSEFGLMPGDIGAVVYVHGKGQAYEVEFVTFDGRTAAVLELEPSQVRPIGSLEIPHARSLRAAQGRGQVSHVTSASQGRGHSGPGSRSGPQGRGFE